MSLTGFRKFLLPLHFNFCNCVSFFFSVTKFKFTILKNLSHSLEGNLAPFL